MQDWSTQFSDEEIEWKRMLSRQLCKQHNPQLYLLSGQNMTFLSISSVGTWRLLFTSVTGVRVGGATLCPIPDNAQHTLIRLQKRQFCAYYSSKKRNILIFEPQLTRALPQKARINSGCQRCGVALCRNSKRDCWARWHRVVDSGAGKKGEQVWLIFRWWGYVFQCTYGSPAGY